MKSKYLVLVFLLISNFSNAWWEQTNGPYGGKINGLAIDGSNIVAATNYGVYVSTNNGSSWAVAFNNVATTGNILSLLVSGTNLFTGTAGGGVYVSANHGATWLPVNTGLPAGSQVNTLTVSGTTIFAGILGKGIYASNNNGATWTSANTGIPSTMTIFSIVVSGTTLFAGSSGGGVYMSTNNGSSWTAVNAGLSSLSVNALVVSGTNIFAGTYDRGVFLSTNNGTSWTSVNSGPLIPFANITSFATIGTNIFAGTKSPDQGPSGVYHTANNGATWTEVNTGLTDVDIKSLAATGTDLFAGTNGGGVFRSINNGSNWFGASNGILHTDVRSLAVNGSFVIAATLGGGVFSSGNAGASWIPGNNGLGNSKILGMGVSGTTLLASPVYDGVYLSTNNGSTWTPTNLSGTPNTFRSFATSGSNMYAGGPTGVFLSTNGGSTWTAANNGLTSGWVNAVATLGSSVVFAGTDFGGIYRSTNNGSSWNTVNTGLIALNIYSLATSGSDIFAGGYGGVYLSKDSGNTWTQLFSVSGSVRSLAIDGTKLFAGGDYGVFVSTDYGNSWSNTGLGHYAMSLVIKGPYLFAGTFEHGIWKRLLCSSSVTQEVGLCNGQSIAVGTHLYDATGIYYDTLVNTGGCDSVVTTRLTVYATPGATIVAIGSPVICNGNSIVLRANTGTGLTYQWALNGVNIPGATSYSWSASVGGDYSCMVNNPCGSATSNTLTVTVNTIPSATISAGGSTAFCTGNSVSLNANTGIGISYQWKLNGTNIGGATSPAFLASAAGSYTCAVSNSCGSATSNAIVVTVDSAPTATITAGGPVIFCSGGSVALNANSGTGLSYQWKLNGVNIAGATSATHVAASAGSYTCAVTNSCGSVVSGSLVVTVNPLPTAIISTGGNPTFCTGGSVLLNANTGAGLTHQWNLNNVIIGGATASSYTALTAGSYTCVVTNSCGSTASNSIVVTVNSIPVMPGVIAGQATGICATSTSYSVGAVAGASVYSWTVPAGAVINSGQGTTNINVTYSIPFSSGTVSVTAGNTCGTSAASNRLVNAALLPTGPVSGNSAPCGNTRVIYSVPAVSGATNYTWTVPPKAKIISGQGTNSVDVRLNQYGGNITVRAGNACTTGTTAVLPITIISCTGNPNRSRTLDAMVFPNPASTAFSLQIHSTREESCWLVVTDMTGRLVEKNGPFAPGEQITFGSELTPGIYSAEVKQGEERKVLRVVKSE